MNQQGQIKNIAAFNQNSLQELTWAIESSRGEFSLILALCNSASLRRRLTQELQASCPVEIREIILEQSATTLYTTIQAELGNERPEALIVSGLESVKAIDFMLRGANQIREEFRKNFPFSMVFWVTDEVLQKLIRLAPDFQSWTTTVEFAIPTEDLIQYIQQTADEVFAKVLQVGAGRFLDSTALNLGIGSPRRTELELARVELQNRGVTLHPEIEASLEFVLGRDTRGSMEQSRQHYERSLALLPNTDAPLPQMLERRACLLYCMGLWWRTYAVLNHVESEHAHATTKDYFQECITVFEQANREDLVANFINGLGAILQRMQRWDELEPVAHRARTLHQTYPHQFRLARAYGFLAEVALAKSAWKQAQESAQEALAILDNAASTAEKSVSSETIADLEWEQSSHQGWYLLALAKAQIALSEKKEAITTLETAKARTKSQYDPELYIQILWELHDCYFKQSEYLKAFHIKLELRSNEQTYGIRAFIGAGRLQPKQQVTNPALVLVEQQQTVAQEIAATGREQDIKRLVERVARPDHKLTIIYGQSGVGKSSILQAGLIPVLKNRAIGTRDVVTVLQQVYPDWIRELRERLVEATPQRRTSPQNSSQQEKETTDTVNFILNQLQINADNELLTVLIFDQFEEFFFVYKDPKQRLTFYNFLRECLDVPHARVILSLREDYLYYLLECNERLTNLEVINNNILDKDILYYLGNFSRKDAKALIKSFTHTTKLLLDAELIDALVEDLAGDFGEIRPIEFQVVGTQLQTEKITTLAQYQEHGPKEALVGRFLEEVVKDCGTENEQIAKLVLYLLTDENNTRPLKTRADLELELDVKAEKLDLVLLILVKSGLVFKIPAVPTDRYQLVHDYLVPFVRQQRGTELLAELEREREQRQHSDARLNRI
ncbi:MAG: tetratricopeptide repeat protein [Scytonema sp. CRU_2_7]|nr:tetratricopeptide repeat protein [Scytonema sp. CRU_2_7]